MLVTEAVIRRVEQSVIDDAFAFSATLAEVDPEDPVVIAPVGNGAVLLLGPGSYVNQAMGMGLQGPVEAADIDRVEQLSDQAGVPPSFEICPLAHPSLLQHLGERCYRITSFRTVMVRDLTDLQQLPAPLEELSITVVDDTSLADWQASAIHGFDIPDGEARRRSDRFSRGRFHTPGETLLLGRIDGEVAGNAALSMRNGVATLGGMATVPAFRRRGVQTTMVAHRLRFAAAHDCDLAVVAADPASDSERNLQRLGFVIAYTEVFLGRERS